MHSRFLLKAPYVQHTCRVYLKPSIMHYPSWRVKIQDPGLIYVVVVAGRGVFSLCLCCMLHRMDDAR